MNLILPQSLDIEIACLNCALLSNQALSELISRVTAEDFYLEKHRIFFECIKELKVTDWPAVKEWYDKKQLEITHRDFMKIYQGVRSNNIDYYINQLLELSSLRKIISSTQMAFERAYAKENSDDIKQQLNNELKTTDRSDIKIYSSQELFQGKTIDDIAFKPEDFIKTGIRDFDEFFYGLYRSELVLIAGRPSTGKSALAMNIAMNQTEPVVYVSLEMPEKFFKIRMIAREAMVNSLRIQHNWKMNDVEKERVQEAIDRLSKKKFFVIDKSGLKKETINNKIRQIYEQHGLCMFVVDYLQIMSSSSRENRYIRIGEDLLMLKDLARDLNIPGIVISSKSRASESSKDLLSGFRESGNIEYDADKAIFLEYENWEENISNDKIDGKIILAKNKNGSIGFAPITFYKAFSKFV